MNKEIEELLIILAKIKSSIVKLERLVIDADKKKPKSK